MLKPVIYLGADHAGFDLKESIKSTLSVSGYELTDVGAANKIDDDDYPVYAKAVAEAVVKNPGSLGILSCGNAEGICIAANKVNGARAAVGYSTYAAKTTRTDDDANILCLPGRVQSPEEASEIAKVFLETAFSNEERHLRRLKQVQEIELENSKSQNPNDKSNP